MKSCITARHVDSLSAGWRERQRDIPPLMSTFAQTHKPAWLDYPIDV
jgi:hypothetical protein